MMALSRRMALGAAVLALFVAGPAAAQENLDQGKTPAQLYAANCAICHKSTHGLSKAGGMFGLQGFLREHYTASRESAAAIAAYLTAVDRATPPRTRASKRPGKPKEKSKTGEVKSAIPAKDKGEAKGAEPKSSEPKQAKPAQAKPNEAAAAEAGAKPAEPKAETKAEAAKPPADTPPAKPAAEPKPDKPEKSD
jgi:hypothetical protein